MTMPRQRPSAEGIEHAASVIDPVFLDSPQIECAPLARELGVASIVLKIETLNPIRSFKGRGAGYYVACLEDETPLVVPSAGNFGQGIAYAARKRGIAVRIFAPERANPLKVERMRAFGATVTLAGADFDAAKDAARDHAARHGLRFVEDGQDPAIAEGAGTMARELGRGQEIDAVLASVGNGALINGIGAWFKSSGAPAAIRVVGVCAAGAPSMERSWRSGTPVATDAANTIADGIAVRVPVAAAVADMRRLVDEVLLVDDTVILRAMRALLEHAGLLVEPSGAAGVAAILAHPERFAGQRVATPLCGGNVTPEQMREWGLA